MVTLETPIISITRTTHSFSIKVMIGITVLALNLINNQLINTVLQFGILVPFSDTRLSVQTQQMIKLTLRTHSLRRVHFAVQNQVSVSTESLSIDIKSRCALGALTLRRNFNAVSDVGRDTVGESCVCLELEIQILWAGGAGVFILISQTVLSIRNNAQLSIQDEICVTLKAFQGAVVD